MTAKAASQAYNELSAGQNSPLINRATSQLYPPGSTFKTIVASAALETGDYQTDTKIPAGSSYTLPGTATQLPNDEAQGEASTDRSPCKRPSHGRPTPLSPSLA